MADQGNHLRRVGAVAAVAAVAALGSVACEPPPPRVPFTVTTTGSGADHSPGDGVCEVTPGEGDCSLPAAIAEANAAGRATISVPAGEYRNLDLTVTGDIELNWGAPAAVHLGEVSVTVAAGATLWAAGLRTAAVSPSQAEVELTVAGNLVLDRSFLADVDSSIVGTPLRVEAGGGAVVTASTLIGGTHGVSNAGRVVLDRSTLLSVLDSQVSTQGAGASVLRASLLSRAVNVGQFFSACSGAAATSVGYSSYAPFASGCTTHPSDVTAFPAPTVSGSTTFPGYALGSASIVVDAIPVGDPLCEVGSVDIAGNPRGVDGNGDGTPGCDIGALERQPAA